MNVMYVYAFVAMSVMYVYAFVAMGVMFYFLCSDSAVFCESDLWSQTAVKSVQTIRIMTLLVVTVS